MIRYILKQEISPGEIWRSDEFEAPTVRHVAQAVIAGFLAKQPRWAETPDGKHVIYGLDAKGRAFGGT
jgi:hypothetical protein